MPGDIGLLPLAFVGSATASALAPGFRSHVGGCRSGLHQHHSPAQPSCVRQLFHRGAVVTDAARCTALGTDVLARHGSSVDAAIASALCAGIVNPHTSGLGG